MNLLELHIHKDVWGKDQSKYKGKAKFGNELGEVILNLTQKHVEAIFNVCADSIVLTAKEAANQLTCVVVENVEQKKLGEMK